MPQPASPRSPRRLSTRLLWFVAAVVLVQLLVALYTALYLSGPQEPSWSFNLFVAVGRVEKRKHPSRQTETQQREPALSNRRHSQKRKPIQESPSVTPEVIPAAHAAEDDVTTEPPLDGWPAFVRQDRTLRSWALSRKTLCGGAFEGFAGLFCVLHDAVLDGSRVQSASGRAGGESLDAPEVMGQPAQHEYFTLLRGLYSFERNTCKPEDVTLASKKMGNAAMELPLLRYDSDLRFHMGVHLMALDPRVESESAQTQSSSNDMRQSTALSDRTAVLVVRYDYANLFQTAADWYDVFFVAHFLQLDVASVDVIFLDAHPYTPLDDVWATLWPSTRRIGDRSQFRAPVKYRRIVWLQQGYSSLLSHMIGIPPIPLVEDFRHFFLRRHNLSSERQIRKAIACRIINSTAYETKCQLVAEYCVKPNILILFRRDYVAHARNPNGQIARKFANEEQVVEAARRTHAGAKVGFFVPTEHSMREQLRRVSEADVFVGMHGAGLTLALFLPPHAALIELFPADSRQPNSHFRHIAMARGLVYNSWLSSEQSLENVATGTTWVPEEVIRDALTQSFTEMCGFMPSFGQK